MTPESDKQRSRRQAWGTTVASTAPMKEMQRRVAGWFAEDLPEDEIRRRLCVQAVQDDFGLRAFLRLNRKSMRLKAADAVVQVARVYAGKLGNKRMSAVLADWAHALGVDTWLADWQIAWYRTGSPPPMSEHLFGGVSRVSLGPEGEEVPMVFAIAGPVSDPEALAEEFVNRCYREFPRSFARKEHVERDAERVRRFQAGETDFQIARDELEAKGWDLVAVNKREYNYVVRSRANSITHARRRWMEYVTDSLESASPSSE